VSPSFVIRSSHSLMGVSYGRTAASSVRRYVALSIERDGRPCDRDRATSVPRQHGVLMTIYCLAAGAYIL